MKDSERLLAIIVGAVVVFLVGFFAFRYYTSGVNHRLDQLTEIEGKLLRQQNLVKEVVRANKKLQDYEQKSLPPKPDIARSLYQHWLLTKAEEAGLKEQVITPVGNPRAVQNIYVQQTFTLSGRARYEQIVQLLDDIYRIDFLHRVSRLSLKPVKDSKDLDLSLTLDAVSVTTAPESKELHTRKSDRLKLDSAEKYQLAIVGRNIFAPENRAPRISGLGRQKGQTNRAVEISAKASDPDPFDNVRFELTKSGSHDARLDSSGKLSWTPRKAGDYEFEITARDDNFPPHVTTEKLIVSITDPPPPPPPPDPPPPREEKLAFDQAKHTLFTAILAVGDESEVWLYIRPTGTTLKLHEGESFEVGSMKGTIREIGNNEFIFESSAKATKGQHLLLTRGELLEQAALAEPAPEQQPNVPAHERPSDEKPAVKPAELKPVDEAQTADTSAIPKAAPEQPTVEKPAEPKAVGDKPSDDAEELQNHEDVVFAAKLPDGYLSLKRDIELMGQLHGAVFAVFKQGVASATVTRENRAIESKAERLAATKGYLNSTVSGLKEQGWTLKTKEIPNLEDVDYDKPYQLHWEFADAEDKPVWVDTVTFFSPQGHLVQIMSSNPEELNRLRAWAATIKSMPLAAGNSKPAPATKTDENPPETE